MGNAEELRKTADDLDKITESTKQAYLLKSSGKISAAKLTELMNAETWLTAKECIKYGFADRLLGEAEPEPEEPEKKEPDEEPEPDSDGEPENPDKEKEDFTEKAMSIIGDFFM